MFSVDSSLIAWLNRPYFDLGSSNGGSIHLLGIEISYQSLIDNDLKMGLQATLPVTFRKQLLQETGLTQYEVNNPLELPLDLRTERWQKFCDYLTNYKDLSTITQLNLIDLLKRYVYIKLFLIMYQRCQKSKLVAI